MITQNLTVIDNLFVCLILAYFFLAFDDLALDLLRWRKKLRIRNLHPDEKETLFSIPEKKIAVLVPTWKESGIISKMLIGNINRIVYTNYHFFVGCYSNDPETYNEILEVSEQTGRVTPVINTIPGPTSKGQILNNMIYQLQGANSTQMDLFLFHDAEDLIHPLSLKLVNFESEKADFVQVPVFSLPVKEILQPGAVYMDEFSVIQTQDLLIRHQLGVSIPSSGVGFSLNQKAIESLLRQTKGELFESDCLTEDYLLGVRCHQLGLTQIFRCTYENTEQETKNWIATLEFFPKKWRASVRQKARWITGISLQSPRKLGWFGDLSNWFFLYRDRKAIYSNLFSLTGLLMIPLFVLEGSLRRISPFVIAILLANTLFLINRLFSKVRAFQEVYGKGRRFEVVLRYPVGILVNGIASLLAIKNHIGSLLSRKPSDWVKTEHELPTRFEEQSVSFGKWILGFILMTLSNPVFTQENQKPCIQIFYDQHQGGYSSQSLGRIHALFVQNLMGHFPRWKQIVVPVEKYVNGLIEECEANIFLGTYFPAEIPPAFLEDFIKTEKPVLWAGYHIWKLPEKDLAEIFGSTFKGLTQLEPESLDENGRPHFFKWYHYKGETFEKYGEFDSKDPTKFNAAFELSRLELNPLRSSGVQVVSWAEHSGSFEKIPYVLVNRNHWFVADSPFSFITEKDRYLIFTDLLFDLLKEVPIYSGKRPAFVRFEDIHPALPLWQLKAYFDMFKEADIPFSVSLIPIFSDPLMVQVDDRTERVVPLNRRNLFVELLKGVVKQKGSIILHGLTHQYKDIKNPFNGLSGDDFEFWDGINNRPIQEDSISYVLNRLETAWDLVHSVGLKPHAWLTPHYQASPLDFSLFGQLFLWNVGRVIYFPHLSNQKSRLPPSLSFDRTGTQRKSERFDYLQDLTVTYPDGIKPNGQFFPFEIWGDIYGQRLIPENLGNIQPFLNEQVFKTQSIEDMIACAKRNRVLRDHWASFFIHPVLVQTANEEGLADYPGDQKKILRLIREVQKLGYEFIDLKTWVPKQNLEIRTELREPPRANDKLLPPAAIIEKAKEGQAEFIGVIADLQRLAPGLESKELLFPYIEILDDLKIIEGQIGVMDLGESLVLNLGYQLTRTGVKWLRIDRDPATTVRNFLFWSENAIRYQVAGLHIKGLALISSSAELVNWFYRISETLVEITDLKSEGYVIEAFEQLQANCLQKIMKLRSELSEKEIKEILEKAESFVAIQSIISFLNEEGLKTKNLDELEVYLSWVGILGKNLQKLEEVVPFYVLAAPGQLVMNIIIKFFTLNRGFDSLLIPLALDTLLPSQIPALGSTLMMLFKDKTIPEEILDLLCMLTSQLYEKYLELKLGAETQELRKFLSQVLLLQAGLNNQVEGSYEITIRDKPGLANLVHLGNGKFFMGISVRYGGEVSVDFSFFQIIFNDKDQTWEAVHYDPNDPVTSNPVNEVFFTKFQIIPVADGNLIEGTLYTAKLTSPYQGKKTGGYLEFRSEPQEKIKYIGGVYKGSDRGYDFRMLIYQVEQRLQGVVLVTGPNKIPVNVDLEYGYYDYRKNVAYLTSGRFESFRWVHIRGEFFDRGDRFEGQYIQSVYGPIHRLVFRKDKSDLHDSRN